MNIFYLDKSPVVSAQLQCDKHVVKMILESAQLLCTAHQELDGFNSDLYKTTHKNHPSAVWVRQSSYHYSWLYHHMAALSEEYSYRYYKRHLTWLKMKDPLSYLPNNLKDNGFKDPPLCMPDQYKSNDPVVSYQEYYKSKRNDFRMSWTKRQQPEWF